jgi:AcrR family transcriptional regulator
VSPKTTTSQRLEFRGDSLETRNKIRAAAAHTIARRGIRGLRVEEVAAAAGVSTNREDEGPIGLSPSGLSGSGH